eukprot:COSAG04_NODE_11562_length_702_cov_0.757877_2_plen_44_part_01
MLALAAALLPTTHMPSSLSTKAAVPPPCSLRGELHNSSSWASHD